MTTIQSNPFLIQKLADLPPVRPKELPISPVSPVDPAPENQTPNVQDQVALGGTPAEPVAAPKNIEPEPELTQVKKIAADNASAGLTRPVLEASLARGIRRLDAVPQLRETAHVLAQDAAPLIESLRYPLATPAEIQSRFQAVSAYPEAELKTYPNLEAALEAVNAKNSGSELVVEVQTPEGGKAFAVVELKSGIQPEQLQASVSYLKGSVYFTDPNRQITVLNLPESETTARLDAVRQLAQVAIADQASGLDQNRASTLAADRYPAYKANLTTSMTVLVETRASLLEQKQNLEAQLETARKAAPPQLEKMARLQTQLSELGGQLTELDTYQTVLTARMSILPKSSNLIPGSEQKIGENRNSPATALPLLEAQLNRINSRLVLATHPEEIKNLEAQKALVMAEQKRNLESTAQIQHAAYSTKMRVGSLATLYQGLDDTQKRLEGNIAKLSDLEDKIQTAKGTELESYQKQAQSLRTQIETDRKQLIVLMKSEVKVFQDHVRISSEGGKKSLEFLNLQIRKLEALNPMNPQAILDLVKETQTQLLSDIQNAAKIYDGITPQEGEMLAQIGDKADQYISDYQVARETQGRIEVDLTRKQQLIENPPLSVIGKESLSQADQVFMKKVEALLKNAPEGSKLEELKKLYTALAMSQDENIDADLRKRIDISKIEAKILDISQEPEVQAAFGKAREEAIQEVFGPEAAQKLADHLLSPEFNEFLGLLSEDEQAQLLSVEIGKLAQLDPQKALAVRQELIGKQLEQKSAQILSGVSLQERKSAFEKVMGTINDPNTALDKGAKIADALAQALDKLSPEEMAQLNDPKKMYTYLSGKLDGMGENGKAAAGFLKSLQKSGGLGAFMALTASVAATGKLPAVFENADFKSIADFSSSALGVAGNGKNIATLFNLTEDTLKSAKALKALSALKFMEFLGPVGDVIGMGVDAYGSYQDFSNGDYIGGTAKGVGALAGGTGAVAGVFILAGSTGPGAPIVLVGAAIVGGLAWVADSIWGESEEETFLRQLDVLKPAPERAPDPDRVEYGRRRYELDQRGIGPKY
ncbi:hypothetical protein COW36_16880 [bacterium (Candidatus Blackallbacteria) CG17_big_fil_post_rev_8_21_14_2_50_48_46]|uniref:Uncharacterized protein n=1 Tax=bacterium (Candidatus Blackallbacteria) CG17_big_fil_post_rev_8_21_14_2_50_48_46 TaxID=2014261 RepID=A0A2M7G185_9BACT|nr:MAG: hypothetical protein COW64_09190 [bacterium (Candidatus Blackallbacteria) CG18_big_fil_WC_8_21_14_2_50_49_26]PIW15478.1 MAG: hypothetical protein COW36_16880 [bacterium (Candidatus Blackallbacteria) CG17_big_fil_post_rev_8_21_14_2_50_48_46]PIW48622.1 MAG: hypothetical protein COW20_08965 [bacterium (Candidatus Blackallbacteria) CG13_big_fil_rev_8_21_14_2_50_49_14]